MNASFFLGCDLERGMEKEKFNEISIRERLSKHLRETPWFTRDIAV
jgi:hypothetical protein